LLYRTTILAESGDAAKLSKLPKLNFATCRHLMKIKRVLTCPISQCILYDPVTLVESGHTFDRTQLCKWLLINPTRCPATGVDFEEKLKYKDNDTVRKILVMYLGDEAYQKYNDSRFRNKYEALDAGRLVEPDATTLLVQKSDDEQARLYYELAAKKGQIDAQRKFVQKRKGCRARLQ
jgi:hypothetical protein